MIYLILLIFFIFIYFSMFYSIHFIFIWKSLNILNIKFYINICIKSLKNPLLVNGDWWVIGYLLLTKINSYILKFSPISFIYISIARFEFSTTKVRAFIIDENAKGRDSLRSLLSTYFIFIWNLNFICWKAIANIYLPSELGYMRCIV